MEEVLIQTALKTITEILYDDGLFDNDDNADEVSKVLLSFERHRPDFILTYKVKNKSTSNMSIQQIRCSLSLCDTRRYLGDFLFQSDLAIVYLHL